MTRSYARLDVRRSQVRDALAGGPLTQAEIAERIGVQQPAVAKVMRQLLEVGDVRLVSSVRGCGRGPWPMRYGLPGAVAPTTRCST
jgi:predicted ArsR family transcriptional regulator